MRAIARLTTTTAAVSTALALVAAPASAAPTGETFELDCGAAGVFTVAVPPGNGEWTPGILTGSTRGVLTPVAFGEFAFVVRDASGEVLFEDRQPGVEKRSTTRGPQTMVTCTFSDTVSAADDLELAEQFGPDVTATFSSSVSGYLHPSGR